LEFVKEFGKIITFRDESSCSIWFNTYT